MNERHHPPKSPRNLTEAQVKAISLALQGMPWKDIAKEVGYTREAIWKWRQNPQFQCAMTQMIEAAFAETALFHSHYIGAAFHTLYRQATNKENKYSHLIEQESAVKLIELTHRNIETIKIVEQNRKALSILLTEVEQNTKRTLNSAPVDNAKN